MLDFDGAAVFDDGVQSLERIGVDRLFDCLFVEHVKERADGDSRQNDKQNDDRQ